MQFRPVLVVLLTVSALAVTLWGIAAAGTGDTDGIMQLDRSGAATVTVIAAMGWGFVLLARWLERRDERRDDRVRREFRRREAAVIRSAEKRDAVTTKPLPRLHSVPEA